jgi:undecaprenyl-diphosphatase
MSNVASFIQGITEFLPISSSLHLELWAFIKGYVWTKDHEVSLHLGTLISLCIYFVVPKHWPSLKTIFCLVIATIPVVVVGWFIKRSGWNAPHTWLVYSTFAGGLGLLLSEYVARRKSTTSVNFGAALLIGLAQVLAFIPGASRMGTTVTMARFMGVSVKEAITFSWMLAMPTVGGAVVLSAWDAWKAGTSLPLNVHQVIITASVGLGFMFIVGKHAGSRLLIVCGYYRIALSFILAGLMYLSAIMCR